MKHFIISTLLLFELGAVAAAGGTQERHIALSEALRMALENNPAVEAMHSQRRAAEARTREAMSGFLPQLSLNASYTRYQEPNIILPIHQVGVFPPLDDQIYDARVQLYLPIFDGGRTFASRRAARAGMHESRVQEEETRIALTERITQIFIQAQEITDKENLITARVRSLQRRHDELSLLLGEGRVSPADLANVSAFLHGARADSIEIAMKKTELALRLGQLTGAGGELYPRLEDARALQKIGVLSDTLLLHRQGPQVRKAQARVEQARAMKALAVRSFLPDISGFATYIYRSGADLDLIGEWAAGVSVKLPLFTGGRRIAKVRQAGASLSAAESNLRAAETAQQTDLELALQQLHSARQRRQRIGAAVTSKATSVAAWQEMHKAGRIPLSELLVRETELLQLQIQERSLAWQEVLSALRYQAIAGTLPEVIEKITVR